MIYNCLYTLVTTYSHGGKVTEQSIQKTCGSHKRF